LRGDGSGAGLLLRLHLLRLLLPLLLNSKHPHHLKHHSKIKLENG
jgi:hypothetical protein